MTLRDMIVELKDNLMLEGATEVPGDPRLRRALNRAKDDIVARVEQVDPQQFAARHDYTVVAGVASVTLPDGATPGTPRCRRILSLTQVQNGAIESMVKLYDFRDIGLKESPAGFWLYREGRLLYFNSANGAPGSMTLRLRYAAAVPDLDGTDADAAYDQLEADLIDLVVIQATLDLLPGNNVARLKWNQRLEQRWGQVERSYSRFDRSQPVRVRHVGYGEEW